MMDARSIEAGPVLEAPLEEEASDDLPDEDAAG